MKTVLRQETTTWEWQKQPWVQWIFPIAKSLSIILILKAIERWSSGCRAFDWSYNISKISSSFAKIQCLLTLKLLEISIETLVKANPYPKYNYQYSLRKSTMNKNVFLQKSFLKKSHNKKLFYQITISKKTLSKVKWSILLKLLAPYLESLY